MKKLFSFMLLIIMVIGLSSCSSRKKFEELPSDEQTKIQQDIQKNIFNPYMQDIMATATKSAGLPEEEMNKIMTEKWEKLKKDLIKFLEQNYPKIDFNTDELSKIDMTFPPENNVEENNEVNTDDLSNIVNEVEDVDVVDVTSESSTGTTNTGEIISK